MKKVLFLLAVAVAFTSCGPAQTAEFKAKEYFYNTRIKQRVVSPYVEIIEVDAHYSVGDTILHDNESYILVSKLPLLADN